MHNRLQVSSGPPGRNPGAKRRSLCVQAYFPGVVLAKALHGPPKSPEIGRVLPRTSRSDLALERPCSDVYLTRNRIPAIRSPGGDPSRRSFTGTSVAFAGRRLPRSDHRRTASFPLWLLARRRPPPLPRPSPSSPRPQLSPRANDVCAIDSNGKASRGVRQRIVLSSRIDDERRRRLRFSWSARTREIHRRRRKREVRIVLLWSRCRTLGGKRPRPARARSRRVPFSHARGMADRAIRSRSRKPSPLDEGRHRPRHGPHGHLRPQERFHCLVLGLRRLRRQRRRPRRRHDPVQGRPVSRGSLPLDAAQPPRTP